MREVLRRLLGASASPVAAGGETGGWQWLLPALVVLVVAFAALDVHAAAGRSERASQRATAASALLTAVQDARAADGGPQQRPARRAMFTALRAVQSVAPSDPRVELW